MNRRGFITSATGMAALGSMAPEAFSAPAASGLKTKHIIMIINGNGARKKEYFERSDTAIHIKRMVDRSTVFTEDHGNNVSNHGVMYTEFLTGLDVSSDQPLFPTYKHYARKANGDSALNYWYLNPVAYYRQWRFHRKYYTSAPGYGTDTRGVSMQAQDLFFEDQKKSAAELVSQQFPDDMGLTAPEKKKIEEFVAGVLQKRSWEPNIKAKFPQRTPMKEEGHALALVPQVLQAFKPRIITVQMVAHDTGHGAGGYLRDETGYLEYSAVAKSTDEMIGQIFDFVTKDPYFSQNTAIVVRPETGRDDEVNLYGEIHHTDGYYYAHRPASIWYGPDFKEGQILKEVVNRMDMCPTLAFLMGADAKFAKGSVRPQLFKSHVTGVPAYKGITRLS